MKKFEFGLKEKLNRIKFSTDLMNFITKILIKDSFKFENIPGVGKIVENRKKGERKSQKFENTNLCLIIPVKPLDLVVYSVMPISFSLSDS